MKSCFKVFAALLLICNITIASAQTTTINAGNWNVAANWSTGTVPNSTTQVIVTQPMNINQGLSVAAKWIFNADCSGTNSLNMTADSLIINADVSITGGGNNLSTGVIVVKSGNTFTIGSINTTGNLKIIIEPGATMVVSGSINNNGASFQVDGTLTVTGSYSGANSSASLTGSGTFTTGGSMNSPNGGTIFGNTNPSCSSNCNGGNLCGATVSILPDVTPVCAGTNVTLNATTSPTPTTYIWQSSTGGAPFTDIATASTVAYSETPAVTTQYRLRIVTAGCTTSSAPAEVIVNPIPSAPTASDVARCGSGTVDLTASGSAGSYTWYDNTSSSVGSGTPFTTPSLSSTATYYVTAVVSGCESAQTSVDAIITNIPSPPTAPDVSRCGTGTVSLTATGSAGTYKWYDDAAGTNLVSSSSGYTTPSISSTTPYYVSAVVSGCESGLTTVNAVVQTCSPVMDSENAKGLNLYMHGKDLYVDASSFDLEVKDLSIINLQGQPVRTGLALRAHDITRIEVGDLKSGLYVVQVNVEGQVVIRRVFVE